MYGDNSFANKFYKMETTHNIRPIPDNQPTEKTNEDYNQRKPNPADPNETKQIPNTEVPNIRGDEKIITEEVITDNTNEILRTFSLFASLGQRLDNSSAQYLAAHPTAIKHVTGKYAA